MGNSSLRNCIVELTVPRRPPCAGGQTSDTTTIFVYGMLATKARTPLYSRVDCLNWLLSYAADELHFQGVPCNPLAAEDQKVANCAAVAGLNLEWDFWKKAWLAEFVEGPLKGVKKSFAILDYNAKLWARMRAQSICEGGEAFDRAHTLQKKKMARRSY